MCGACAAKRTILTTVGHDDGDVDDDGALGAYGGILDVAAHVPTLTGAITAAIAAGLVCTWRRAWRKRRHA
jgi:hypothetical protein